MPCRRKLRLPDFDYRGCHRYFITVCTDAKRPFFENETLVKVVLDVLAEESGKFDFTVWGYCFMPDHLHLVLEGKTTNADMPAFIRAFKQKTGYAYRRRLSESIGRLWQAGYYDHVLRRDEDLQSVLQYVFNNPVRKQMVSCFTDYPHLGSFAVEIGSLAF
jgi:putative transposase